MKRKLFSAILFGALLTASTSGLTSCKDYDDDISNLQSQIDKLATADQLSAKVAEMQAAISAAQSAAESKAAAAQSVADAAKSAAADAAAAASKAQSTADGASQAAKDAAAAAAAADEVAKAAQKAIEALEAKAATKEELKAAADAAEAAVKAIQDAHAKDVEAINKAIETGLNEVKAEIAETNAELAALAKRLDAVETKLAALEAGEGQEEVLAAIQEEVEAIADSLEALIGEYTSMVTDVDLYVTRGDDKGIFNKRLDFIYVAQEKTTTFPAEDGVADAQIEFSEKNKDVTTTDSLLIRVSPTNAVLNAANVSLINSQGKELSEYIEVKEVKPYNELITRAAEGNGLWNVVFKVKEGIDREAFTEAVTSGGKSVLFAVAVKNTESNDVRRVISAYDVVARPSTYEPARSDFQATNSDGEWKDVSKIHNRFYYVDDDNYGATSKCKEHADANEGKTEKDIPEYAWKNEPKIEGSKTGFVFDENDVRSETEELLEVAVGQEIKLSVGTYMDGNEPSYDNMEGTVGAQGNNYTNFAIKGFYVTLDKEFAIESSPSEWNAWKKYSYTNVGIPGTETVAKMFYGNTGSISIDDEDALGDVIGFRVYAVNLDGTLVDPDGRAFYVRVGEEKIAASLTIDDLEAELNYTKINNKYVLHFNGSANSNYYSEAVALSDEVLSVIESVDDSKIVWSIVNNPSAYGNNSVDPIYTAYKNANNSYEIEFLNKNGDVVAGADLKDATKARVVIKDPLKFLDDAEYTAKATLKNKVGTAVCDVTVKFTKIIPTEAPALTWTDGYDPNNQVFADAAAGSANIYKIDGNDKPYAVELKTLLNKLNYGSGVADQSWYTLHIKSILNADGSDVWEATIGNEKVGKDSYTDYSNYLFDAQYKKAIDGKQHEIVYCYNYGKISLKKNYQTAKYTEDYCNPAGAEALSMKFNTWSMFEQYALKQPLTLTYYQAGNTDAAGWLNLGYTAGSSASGEEIDKWSVSNGVYAIYKENLPAQNTDVAGNKIYFKQFGENFYWFNPETGKFRHGAPNSIIGNDFADPTETVTQQVLDNYGFKLVIDKSKVYVNVSYKNAANKTYSLLVEAKATSGSDEATLCKKIGGDYYKVIYQEATNSYLYVDRNGAILNNQSESNVVKENQGVLMPNGITAKLKNVYVWVKGKENNGSNESKSDVDAWNTVVFNWTGTGNDAIPQFGSASKKQDFGWLVANNYLEIVKVETAESDPFEIKYETMPTDKKFKITQKVGTLVTGNTGTIYVTVKDCFDYKTKIALTYSIR